MSERTYTGKLVDDRDGFEATASDTFHMIQLELGTRCDTHTMSISEAEAFARWILKIHPYGYRKIT